MSPVLACWLAGEFAVIALAKVASGDRQATVSPWWLARLDRRVLIGWDVACAALLLLPGTCTAAAVAVLLTVGLGAVVQLSSGGAGCGCFGTAASRFRWSWRDAGARLALAGQAVLLCWLPDVGWVLGMLAGAVGALLLVAAQPQLVRPSRALTLAEALRRLGTEPQLLAWQPQLLSDQPASAEPRGRALRLTFDALAGDTLILLVVDVSRHAVTVHPVDPFTLAPVH